MKRYIFRAANLVLLLLAEAWLISQPGWEPLIVFIGFLATMIAEEIHHVRKKPSERDRVLARQFLDQFPSTGTSCRFLSEHDIGVPFHARCVSEIEHFIEGWANAEHEFIDAPAEAVRRQFLDLAQRYMRDLGESTDDPSNKNVLTIGMTDMDDRAEIHETRDRLNRMASELHKKHQDLVRVITKRILA